MHVDARPNLRHLIPALCLFLGAALAWFRWGGAVATSVAAFAGLFVIWAVLAPRRYERMYCAQEKLLLSIVRAFSWCVLAVVFVMVFVPGRIVLSISRRRRIARGKRQDAASSWHEIPAETDEERFKRQY